MKKRTAAIIGFVILLLVVFAVWRFTRLIAVEGSKNITLEVIHGDGSEMTVPISTDAENLRSALEQVEGLIDGEDGPYGLMVYTVDEETADWDRDQSWWCLTKDGEMLDTGVDATMIEDGGHYEFTYTIG